MRPVYGRSRVLLAPSLWWESGSRVLVEASLNAIPAIVTQSGGSPEMIGSGGITLTLPENMHKPPFNTLLRDQALVPIINALTRFFDDDAFYQTYARRALAHGRMAHGIERNADSLLKVFETMRA